MLPRETPAGLASHEPPRAGRLFVRAHFTTDSLMPTPSFLLVADRGGLKAYSVEPTPQHGPMPRLVAHHAIDDAHGRFADKFTDQAGGFPVTGGQANAIAERQGLRMENDQRIFRQLAGHITALLREHQPTRWGFAAPAEISGAILAGVPAELHERLTRNVPRDLIKTEPSALLTHFDLPDR